MGRSLKNGLYNLESMVDMTVSEMLNYMIWGNIEDIENKQCGKLDVVSTEPKKHTGLRKALHILVNRVNKVGFSINGGKDSLSMNVKVDKDRVKSPNALVLSGYTTTQNYKKSHTIFKIYIVNCSYLKLIISVD